MRLLVAIFVVALLAPATAQERIIRVIDGDTVKLENGENARLKYIDAPELKGKCEAENLLATSAKKRLEKLLATAGEVDIQFHGRGYYRRPLITIAADGRDVGEILVDEGLARPYTTGGKLTGWCDGTLAMYSF